jgi:hypothetical protein
MYCFPNIIWMIKSRILRWARHVAHMGWGEVLTGKGHHLEDPGIDGSLILKWIFEKWDGDVDWIDLAQDSDRCRAFVNAVRNLWVP